MIRPVPTRSISAAIDFPSYTGSVTTPSRRAHRRIAAIVFSSGMPYVPACHSSSRTISESSSSRPSSIASAVKRAMRAICAHVCATVAEPSIPRTARSRFLGSEPRDHPRLGGAGHRADDDRVEEDAELALLLCHLVSPACETEPAERMIRGTRGNRVRLSAALPRPRQARPPSSFGPRCRSRTDRASRPRP